LGASALIFIFLVYLRSKKEVISSKQLRSIKMVLHTTTLQFVLGVTTLLFSVPIILGILHQLVAVTLLMTLVVSYYLFKYKT
jgi:cytochrome c oxidase assembly protein subunit 15